MRVQDLMDTKYPFIYSDELTTRARAVLRERGLRVLPVLDENKRVVGMISRSEVMALTSSVSPIRVEGVMSTHSLNATPDMEIVRTLREMIRTDQWYVPVVKSSQDQSYAGVLGLEHFILKALEKEVARLNLPLAEVMSTQLFTCSADDETDNVWQTMKKRSFAACPVVERGKPVGMVTQQDLLESGSLLPTFEDRKGRFKSPSKISTVMKTSIAVLRPTDMLKDAAILLLERNIGRVLIVDDREELVGIVDREDVVKGLIRIREKWKR